MQSPQAPWLPGVNVAVNVPLNWLEELNTPLSVYVSVQLPGRVLLTVKVRPGSHVTAAPVIGPGNPAPLTFIVVLFSVMTHWVMLKLTSPKPQKYAAAGVLAHVPVAHGAGQGPHELMI